MERIERVKERGGCEVFVEARMARNLSLNHRIEEGGQNLRRAKISGQGRRKDDVGVDAGVGGGAVPRAVRERCLRTAGLLLGLAAARTRRG